MKKTFLALLISSALLLTACDDKANAELTSKLQQAEQTIAQLNSELAKKSQDLTALQSKAEASQTEIPSLNVEIYPAFSRSETVKNKDIDGNPQESELMYFYSLANTGVQWLDNLLAKTALSSIKEKTETDNPLGELKAELDKQYQQDLKSLKEDGGFRISYTNETAYLGQRGNIVSFSMLYNTYTGGAHGNYSTTYLNIDSQTKEIITLDKLVPKANQKELRNLLWEAYEQRAGYDEAGKIAQTYVEKKDFELVDNFRFDDEGVTFIYAPYAIGPFAEGEIALTVSWYSVNKLLNPAYQRTKKDGFELIPFEAE